MVAWGWELHSSSDALLHASRIAPTPVIAFFLHRIRCWYCEEERMDAAAVFTEVVKHILSSHIPVFVCKQLSNAFNISNNGRKEVPPADICLTLGPVDKKKKKKKKKKMKSMNNNNNNNNGSWLGFSLSSHMNMEVPADPHHHHHSQPPPGAVSAASASFFLSPQLSSSGFSYGVSENGGYYSQLSSMPLKSNGLDSIYYHQNPEPEGDGGHHHPSGILHEQLPYFQPLQQGICSLLTSHEMYQAPLEGQAVRDETIPRLRNWVTGGSNGDVGDGMGGSGPVAAAAMGYGDLQSLSLSMSPVSQSSCVTAPQHASSATADDYVILDPTKKRGAGKGGQKQPVHRKSIDTFGQRTSQYRGVTRSLQIFLLFFPVLYVVLCICCCYLLPLSFILMAYHSGASSTGTDGPADTKPICGTTVARRKAKPGKEGKVSRANRYTYIRGADPFPHI
ncbi:hypothetical protein B296_00035920 [Ensete ventricosum]|uniref:Uncharacterized protein n=1 Tax=Ensete ventricosum TaxID=4639 RepID=A0A427A1C9_ENSVE|nr:hypothetical protein B296_00035920 [Ensete ventricosum]